MHEVQPRICQTTALVLRQDTVRSWTMFWPPKTVLTKMQRFLFSSSHLGFMDFMQGVVLEVPGEDALVESRSTLMYNDILLCNKEMDV